MRFQTPLTTLQLYINALFVIFGARHQLYFIKRLLIFSLTVLNHLGFPQHRMLSHMYCWILSFVSKVKIVNILQTDGQIVPGQPETHLNLWIGEIKIQNGSKEASTKKVLDCTERIKYGYHTIDIEIHTFYRKLIYRDICNHAIWCWSRYALDIFIHFR